MKKIILLVILFALLFALCSCGGGMENSNNHSGEFKTMDYEVIVIDGCEYLATKETFVNNGWGYFAHKGNCTNPIHCHNQ